MSKLKHTPLDRLKHHVTGAIERGEAKAVEGHAPNVAIGYVDRDGCFTVQEQIYVRFANARLIAAAPDLLHALKGIMDLLDSGYLVRNIDDDLKPDFALRQIKPIGIFKSAIDAISKAEGLQK